LNYGGAETQVTILANGLARSGHAVSLLVFYPDGPLRERLSTDVTLRCLEKRGRWDVIGFLPSLFRVLDEEQADVLYAFLPVANLLACLTRLRSPKLKVAWGVRASDMDLTRYDWLSGFTYWLERRFSRCPNLIIANSAAGRRYAVSRGFPDNDRFIVIPNGIDVRSGVSCRMRRWWALSPASIP
jgi:glycosyltransferase involved in cell wall biosynthesis